MIKQIELENFRKFETLSINTESKIVILLVVLNISPFGSVINALLFISAELKKEQKGIT